MVTVPAELTQRYDELLRVAEADEEAAAGYAEKAIELRQSALVARAEAAGIDRAISAFRALPVEAVTRRHVPRFGGGNGSYTLSDGFGNQLEGDDR